MKRALHRFALGGALAFVAFALTSEAFAQRRPYIGYTYPAGGQQATTFQIKLGGQDLDDVCGVRVSGEGVSARILEYHRKLNPQEIQLLNEQLRELKRASPAAASLAPKTALDGAAQMTAATAQLSSADADKTADTQALMSKIEQRTREWVQVPACASISSLVIAEVTVSPDAESGPRELRIETPRGVSNPLVFHVGGLREYARPPMRTASIQILGKEALALRKRAPGDAEVRIDLPCTVNGQIASGEENRYRFLASKGQRLVITTQARQLIPYVADAVPGWFQPVLTLFDAAGKEVAFADDYRFQPDPVILYEVPADGEYVFAIRDNIFRGREDFVYRITVGELPFVTSVFPLGAQADAAPVLGAEGWNVSDADLGFLPARAGGAVHALRANRLGYESNGVPFAFDALPDAIEREPNNTAAVAEQIALPVIINGRINRPDDWDVFQFAGQAGQKIVLEVQARRFDSPLDSVLKLTDAAGNLVAFSDDREDLAAGANTHHADSYVAAKLPATGHYFIAIGDAARKGGEEYGYRLRVSAPQPDFELRTLVSSVGLPINSTAGITVFVARKDGFNGPIKLTLQDPPAGLSAAPLTIAANQTTGRLTIKSGATPTEGSVSLNVVGSAKIGEREVIREAVPCEDRMQAFLWRHLVPARELLVLVHDPRNPPPARRPIPARPPEISPAVMAALVNVAPASNAPTGVATVPPAPAEPPKPKFTKQQIAGRLRQLKLLYEEGLLTDAFYLTRVAECDTAQ